jgi:hypothetical protein
MHDFGMGTAHLHPATSRHGFAPAIARCCLPCDLSTEAANTSASSHRIAVFGLVRVLPYAMKLQANGELRAGKILSIGRVR